MSKRHIALSKKIDINKKYLLNEAIVIVKDSANAKFDETVELSINLGIDAKKSDQNVRGAIVLPAGTGKASRVAVFTQGDNVEKAKNAGADEVGMENLMKLMQDGDIKFDTIIASPDAMGVVGRIGKLLGPRGLMPNPKVGTLTSAVDVAVKNAKLGQVRYRNDKAGIVHVLVGKASFDVEKIKLNINAVVSEIKRVKPSSAKGVYLKKISICSTMGVGVDIDLSDF